MDERMDGRTDADWTASRLDGCYGNIFCFSSPFLSFLSCYLSFPPFLFLSVFLFLLSSSFLSLWCWLCQLLSRRTQHDTHICCLCISPLDPININILTNTIINTIINTNNTVTNTIVISSLYCWMLNVECHVLTPERPECLSFIYILPHASLLHFVYFLLVFFSFCAHTQ